jgi:hypothetical protein
MTGDKKVARKASLRPRRVAPGKAKISWGIPSFDGYRIGRRLRESLGRAASALFVATGQPHRRPTVDDYAEILGVDKKTVERWFRGENLSWAQRAFTIGAFTGDSIDSILGFANVPTRRGDSVATRDAEELRRRIQSMKGYAARAPRPLTTVLGIPHWHKRLTSIPDSPDELLTAAAEAVWKSRLDSLKERWMDSLEGLATLMKQDAMTLADSGLKAALHAAITRVRFEMSDLDSSASPVETIDRLEVTAPLVARGADTLFMSPPLRTTFAVVGAIADCGLAWRGKRMDYAWYIDPSDLRARHRNRGRFLERDQNSFLASWLDTTGLGPDALASLGFALPLPIAAEAPPARTSGRNRK